MRILSLACPLPDATVDNYDWASAPSFFDYDAIVVDPADAVSKFIESVLTGKGDAPLTYDDEGILDGPTTAEAIGLADMLRRRREETERLLARGGLVVCYAQPDVEHRGVTGFNGAHRMYWLPAPNGKDYGPQYVKPALGMHVETADFEHPFANYLEGVRNNVHYRALFTEGASGFGGHVLGRSPGGAAIAAAPTADHPQPERPPGATGAAQPSPYEPHSKTMLLLLGSFLGAALLVHLLFVMFAQQRLVLDAVWEYHPGSPATASVESAPFTLSGRASNLVVEISSTLAQSWTYFTLTLVDEETGAARTFGREVSYYFGRDSDGSWSEGAPWDRAWLPSVPAGRYVLMIEPEGPGPVSYRVRLTRDVPRPLWVWLAVGLLLVPPLLFWWRQWRFEQRRWEDSDHPRSGGSSSSGDDDE